MCCIETKYNVNVQIADKDFKVYKIVLDANKQSCTSFVRGFNYTVNTLYAIPLIKCEVFNRNYEEIKIEKAYHSYTGIHFICGASYYNDGATRCRDLLFGKRVVCIPFENEVYILNLIIVKCYMYIINTMGEVVTDKIIYIDKYLKL